ncbi:hypothetical protein SH661x_004684 [Planctomicrobium sp. SH661]|uniref:Flp family type IVb pilin n=1 Tax=Planctomicrobium sp. SH661 TaxID=3448124 RepID=UPI003F5B5379
MKRLITALWADEAGFILSAELVIIATVAVLGLTVMLVAVRDSIGGEMTDLANAFRNVDQSYRYGGMLGCRTRTGFTSWTAGSGYLDPQLRQPGSELDIVVEDHIVGCSTFVEKAPCVIPAAPVLPACPSPCGPAPCDSVPCGPAPCGQTPCGAGPCDQAHPCTTPGCPEPCCGSLPLQAPLYESPVPAASHPVLPAPPCHDCESSLGDPTILPPPSSDIPPRSVRRSVNPYDSRPVMVPLAGPLQVW